jgi:hypothetical protein
MCVASTSVRESNTSMLGEAGRGCRPWLHQASSGKEKATYVLYVHQCTRAVAACYRRLETAAPHGSNTHPARRKQQHACCDYISVQGQWKHARGGW